MVVNIFTARPHIDFHFPAPTQGHIECLSLLGGSFVHVHLLSEQLSAIFELLALDTLRAPIFPHAMNMLFPTFLS